MKRHPMAKWILLLLPTSGCVNADAPEHEKNRLRAIGLMVEDYRQSRGSYPPTLESARDFAPDVSFVDSWGTSVEYDSDGKRFSVTSAGPDRTFGTSDDLRVDSTAVLD